MIPIKSKNFTPDISIITSPSETFKLNIKKSRISNNIYEAESLSQAIYKILNTPRYQYSIYNWDYGIELDDLYGMPIAYVKTELERRITEAISIDDRVSNVYNFEISNLENKGELLIKFVVSSIFGEINLSWEVEV